MDKSPFAILGLNDAEARALRSLSPEQRHISLSHLRKYYGSVLHPDITGNSSVPLAQVNEALDALERNFIKYFKGYVTQSDSSRALPHDNALREQVQFWKNKADRARPEFQSTIMDREKQIESLGKELLRCYDVIKDKEQRLRGKEMSLVAANRSIQNVRNEVGETISLLRGIIVDALRATANASLPANATATYQVVGKRLRRAGRVWFKITPAGELYELHSLKDTLDSEHYKGIFLGTINRGQDESLGHIISGGNPKYDIILSRVRPYLAPDRSLVYLDSKHRLCICKPQDGEGIGDG